LGGFGEAGSLNALHKKWVRLDIRNPGAIFLRPGSGSPKRDQEWTNLVVELARFIDMRRESPI
jgi:hypothetical protein